MGLISKLADIGRNYLVAGALGFAILGSPVYAQQLKKPRSPKEPANFKQSEVKEYVTKLNAGRKAKREAEFQKYDAKKEAEAQKYDAEMVKKFSTMPSEAKKELEELLSFENFKKLVGEEKVRDAGERIKVCEQLWNQNPVEARDVISRFYKEGFKQKLFTSINQYNVGILNATRISEEDLDREEKIWDGYSEEEIKKYRRISAERKVVALFKDKEKLKETYGNIFPWIDFNEFYNPNTKKNYDGELFFIWMHARSINRVERYNEKLSDKEREKGRFVEYLFRSVKLHPDVKKLEAK